MELDEGIIQEDGSLYSLGWYLCWNKGEEYATLDGPFTAQELLHIAKHMINNKGSIND